MIWILTTNLILWRCWKPYHRHQQQICPCAVWTNRVVVHLQTSPFLLPIILHQISKRRPCFVNIPFWVAWWGNVLYKSHRSWLLLSPRTLKYSTFISGFPRSFWCDKSKHNKIPFAASQDQIHLRLRFCCDSIFTCLFLRSFRHHFGAACWAKDADIWTDGEEDSIHHMWYFPWSICLWSVFLWCQCILFGSWGQNWFYQTTNQEQLSVGSGNMSHCWTSAFHYHLDHCFVVFKHIQTKLPSEKNWRLKK